MTVSFLLLVRADPAGPAPVAAFRLHGPADATTLRDGGRSITDGPFTELAEPVVAVDVLRAEGLDDAVRAVTAHPPVADGVIELRALLGEDDDAPAPRAGLAARRYLLLHALPAERPVTPAPTRSLPEWLADPSVQAAVLAGGRLQDADEATAASVRMHGGEATIARGAAAELTDAIAGYDLVAAEHLDDAIAIARPHPTLGFGVIEIRPLVRA